MNLNQHGAPLIDEALNDPEELVLHDASEITFALIEHIDQGYLAVRTRASKNSHIPAKRHESLWSA